MIKVDISTQSPAWRGRARPVRAGDLARCEVKEPAASAKTSKQSKRSKLLQQSRPSKPMEPARWSLKHGLQMPRTLGIRARVTHVKSATADRQEPATGGLAVAIACGEAARVRWVNVGLVVHGEELAQAWCLIPSIPSA